jgi:hypothetical protein
MCMTRSHSGMLTSLDFRQLLDELLGQDEYAAAGQAWGEDDRDEAVQFWHKLDGESTSMPF